MKTRAMTFFKIGAWILLAAGFAHAFIAVFDIWLKGAFSPISSDASEALKETSINIVSWLGGGNTAVFESAWGAYIGFAIAVGILTGFVGLILLISLKHEPVINNRVHSLLNAALGISGTMTFIAALFYFWFPLTALAASLVCFILARIYIPKGVAHAAG